jgi:hypothetical protein
MPDCSDWSGRSRSPTVSLADQTDGNRAPNARSAAAPVPSAPGCRCPIPLGRLPSDISSILLCWDAPRELAYDGEQLDSRVP